MSSPSPCPACTGWTLQELSVFDLGYLTPPLGQSGAVSHPVDGERDWSDWLLANKHKLPLGYLEFKRGRGRGLLFPF